MNIHTRMAGLGGGKEGGKTSPVGGHRIITGLIPANVIPDEILTDHPKRFRAMIVESTNPCHSLADSQRDARGARRARARGGDRRGAHRDRDGTRTTCCRRRRSSRSGRRRSSRSSSRRTSSSCARRSSRALAGHAARAGDPLAVWCARDRRARRRRSGAACTPPRRRSRRVRAGVSPVHDGASRPRGSGAGDPLRDARPDASAPATRRRRCSGAPPTPAR